MIVHVPAAATVPPASATLPLPAIAVIVPPVQVVDALGGVATTTLTGNVSVSAIPLNAAAPEAVFATVIVNVEDAPDAIDVGENAFVRVGFGGAVNVSLPVVGV